MLVNGIDHMNACKRQPTLDAGTSISRDTSTLNPKPRRKLLPDFFAYRQLGLRTAEGLSPTHAL